MKIRSKNGETMFWVEKHSKMVRFINGIAEVDNEIGKAMIACGYKQEGVEPVSTPKKVVEPKPIKVATNATQPKFKV
jgi:hypothetical protein